METRTQIKEELADTSKRQANLLRKLCPNSGDCVSLGKYIPLLKQYFENFNYKYLYEIKRIGVPSANGFVNSLTYRKDGYDAYCVLKSSAYDKSDNLLLEWWIGTKFINKLVNKFPCFLETYALSTFVDNLPAYELLKNSLHMNQSQIQQSKLITLVGDKEHKTEINDIIGISCKMPTIFSVLIQHLNPSYLMTFEKFIEIHKTSDVGFCLGIFQVLLQVYIPLGSLANNFTHNDLHTSNVLIYVLPNKQYVTLTYKFRDKTITMKTPFIVKIIDYGRCYYKDYDNPKNSTLEYLELLKKNRYCSKPPKEMGYRWFFEPDMQSWFISQIKPNVSKDLWLLYIVGATQGKYRGGDPLTTDLRHLMLADIIDSPDGYMSIASKTMCDSSKPICNVITAMNKLCEIWLTHHQHIEQLQQIVINEHNNYIGELTIFTDDLAKDSVFVGAIIPDNTQLPIPVPPSLIPPSPSQLPTSVDFISNSANSAQSNSASNSLQSISSQSISDESMPFQMDSPSPAMIRRQPQPLQQQHSNIDVAVTGGNRKHRKSKHRKSKHRKYKRRKSKRIPLRKV